MKPVHLIRFIANIAVRIIKPLFGRNQRVMGFFQGVNDRLTLITIAIFHGDILRSIRTAKDFKGKFGVNVVGYVTAESGVGEGTRANIRAIEKTGTPFTLNNLSSPSRKGDGTYKNLIQENNPYLFNLIHSNPDSFPLFLQEKGIGYLAGKYNIGFWCWELSNLPKEWRYCFQYLNEIWVASNFCKESISGASPIPVIKIPPSIVVENIKDVDRSYFRLKEGSFIFLFMFDFLSYFERKNPMAVIKAFKTAFSPLDDVQLVLKCSNSEWCPETRDRMVEDAKGLNVKFIDGYLGKDEINALMSLSDCYISLHRSEGFGLPLAEAMYLKKPVIATGYSSNIEFMNEKNSFPIKYRLVEIEKDIGPYKKGNVWADADVEHAAELMRLVYEKKDMARSIGEIASEDIKRELSPEATGKMILNRLESLVKNAALIY